MHLIEMLAFLSFGVSFFFHIAFMTAADKRVNRFDDSSVPTVTGAVFCIAGTGLAILIEYTEMAMLDHNVPYLLWSIVPLFSSLFITINALKDRNFLNYILLITPARVRKLLKIQTASLACC